MANSVILILRTMSYVAYGDIIVHFGINIAFVFCSLAAPVALVAAGRKTTLTGAQKIFYSLNCAAAVVLSALIIGWEFYR